MNKDKALDRILDEVLFDINEESILAGLKLAYGTGYDDGRKSKHEYKKKKVIQLNLIGQPIKLWDSITQAERILGIGHNNIRQAALGNRKTAGGFKWAFPETQ